MTAKPRLEADRAELARFIDATFRYADDGTHAVLRTFAEGSSGVLGSVRVQLDGAGLEQLVEHATHQATKAANAERPAVFAPPVATFLGKRARECDLGNGLVLSVEADHAPAVARRNLEFLLGPATVVVASGGLWIETDEVEDKLHLHWRCREPSRSAPEHAVLKRARALSCALVGADATAISLVHPLRWPGSWHRKAEPRLARIIDLRTDVEIEPAEVVEDLEPLVPVPPADRRAPGTQQCRAELDEQDLQALGEVIANPDLEWAKWNRLGLAFFAASGGSDAGFEAFDQLSRRSEKYGREETVLRWQHYPRSPADRLGPGTLIYEARRADPTFRLPSRQPGTGARRTRSFDAALGDLHAEQEQAICNPDLVQLLERVGQEPSVAFEVSSLRVLAAARENDPPAFQRALDQLKRGGVRLRDLDRELRRSRLRVIEGGPGSGSGGVVLEAAGTYFVARGAIALQKETRDGLVPQLLCNFSARILAEEVLDDGAEQRRVFVIEGRLADGRSLPCTRISAERYPAMSWVTEAWGTGPVIFAGQGKRDHLRAAIQMLSGSVPRRNVYGHLGWRKLGDDWVFIHSTGGLNHRGLLDDIEVETSIERLQDYVLPSPPTRHELRQAVRASLDLLDLAPDAVSVPVFGATYRAPLGEAAVVDFALHLTGPTGVFKSELAALAQAHFGPGFHGKHLPAGWVDTSNMLEKRCFLAKDAILVVDDFAPAGTVADVQRLHREADRLFRAAGNRAGRARMRADGGARPTYWPRGLIISTGEEIPTGQSLRARLLILEVSPDDIEAARPKVRVRPIRGTGVDVAAWLHGLGLEKYAELFTANVVGLDVLPDLTDADLKELGVPLGDRRRLLKAAEALRPAAADAAPAAGSAPVESPGERRQVAVLFADLAGYTALARELDAEEVHDLLDGFFSVADGVIEEHGGSVDKHIGDCVMAVFGAPVAHGNDAERAARAALAIWDAMPALSERAARRSRCTSAWPAAKSSRAAPAAQGTGPTRSTGDSVNLASRLTDLAAPGEVLVSDAVRRALAERLECDDVGALDVKGITEPVRAWRLLGLRASAGPAPRALVGRKGELRQFEAALAACRGSGRGQALYVRGEAGIGKSRLVEEFARLAAERGFAYHVGLVLDFGAGTGRDAIRGTRGGRPGRPR